jgi:hypothetical protein
MSTTSDLGFRLWESAGEHGPCCAIDISEDGSLLAAGFEKGAIVIIRDGKTIKVCKEVHTNQIMVLGFVFCTKKYWSVFSSDDRGTTRVTHFEKGLLGVDYLYLEGLG